MMFSLNMRLFLGLLFRKYLYLFNFWKGHTYIGQYRLMHKIGSGGMGTIYKAHAIRDKTSTVAIKLLNEDLSLKKEFLNNKDVRKRFEREATIIESLDHPHIVQIKERGQVGDKMYIAK